MKNSMYKKNIRIWLAIFMLGLLISGITAFPIASELVLILPYIPAGSFLGVWISDVFEAVTYINAHYPFIPYGTDWLAFAHIVIAAVFIGPIIDPVKNIFVIKWGIFSCIAIFPLAFIAGPLREVPFFWRLVDCSFGIIGLIPMLMSLRLTLKLKEEEEDMKKYRRL